MDRDTMTFEEIKSECSHWVEIYTSIAKGVYPHYTDEFKDDFIRDSVIWCLDYQEKYNKMNSNILKYLVKKI